MRKLTKAQAEDVWVKKWFEWSSLHLFLDDFHPHVDGMGRITMVCDALDIYYEDLGDAEYRETA